MVLQERIELSTSPLPINRLWHFIYMKTICYKSSILFCSIPQFEFLLYEQYQYLDMNLLLFVREWFSQLPVSFNLFT
jgi:hypothetical protein